MFCELCNAIRSHIRTYLVVCERVGAVGLPNILIAVFFVSSVC